MRCLECQVTMKEVPLGRVRIDRCPHCEGVWFDRGELQKARMGAQRTGKPTRTLVRPARATSRATCPACERSGVETVEVEGHRIERCRDCRGMHVSAEQLEAMLAEWRARANRLRGMSTRLREKARAEWRADRTVETGDLLWFLPDLLDLF